jgi:hypothetical protein
VPNDSRKVPRKQKTSRPEWRGITRVVSPKKIGTRKKGISKLRNIGKKETWATDPCGSKRCDDHPALQPGMNPDSV